MQGFVDFLFFGPLIVLMWGLVCYLGALSWQELMR